MAVIYTLEFFKKTPSSNSNVKQSSRNPFFTTILFSSSSNCQELLPHSQLRTLLRIYLRKLRQSVENCSQAPMNTSAHMPTPVPNTVDHQCVFPLWAMSYVLWITPLKCLLTQIFLSLMLSHPTLPETDLVKVTKGYRVLKSNGQFIGLIFFDKLAVFDTLNNFLLFETLCLFGFLNRDLQTIASGPNQV